MCSLTESELEPELVKTLLDPSQLQTCKKCKENKPSVNLRVNDVYCKDCFLTSVHHKFRATLGKHKAMRPGDKVCVGFSGGGASTALLHLLKTGIESDHKKLLFNPVVLHVDEGSLLQLHQTQRMQNIRKVVDGAGFSGFPVSVSFLEDPSRVYSFPPPGNGDSVPDFEFQDELAEELYQSVLSFKENSAKEDFINTIRRRALISSSRALQCSKLFTAEHSTKVSVDLLTGVSLGKGVNLAHETGFRDTRADDVMLLRPLRDVSGKELALFARFHGLHFQANTNISTGKDSLFSIRKLTEEFLVGLQADFPGTLSTVFRTGDKLQVDTDDSTECCILCEGPKDTDADEHCALQATYWSTIVSTKGTKLGDDYLSCDNLENLNLDSLRLETTSCDSRTECCGEGDGSCRSNRTLRIQDVLPLLCYSCMRTVTNSRNLETLPRSLLDQVRSRRNRLEMKNEIKDFLL